MLGMKKYSQEYIDACRAQVDAGLRAYRKHFGKAPFNEFEARFFNDQVLVLEYMFEHRLSGIEGRDGNPLNEVRVLSNSMLLNNAKLQIGKLPEWPNSAVANLTLPSENSVLGLEAGDKVVLSEDQFVRLSEAFFAEIEEKYL